MKTIFRLLLMISLLISCNNNDNNETKKESELVMYQPSEMASLMNTMYHMNGDIKKKILNNEDIGSFPERYLTIHTAELTDTKDRTNDFKKFSHQYVENMKVLFEGDSNDRKSNFNNAIQSCIECHQTSCRGPIPRIKKLLIK